MDDNFFPNIELGDSDSIDAIDAMTVPKDKPQKKKKGEKKKNSNK